MKTWQNVVGSLQIECSLVAGMVETESGVAIPELNGHIHDDGIYTVVIDFTSTGWYSPGNYASLPERSSPPEGDEERLLVAVSLQGETLPASVQKAIWERFCDEVYAVEVEV